MPYSATDRPPASWHLFADESWLNTKLSRYPNGKVADPNGPTKIARMVSRGLPGQGSPSVLAAYGVPTYFGTATDPLYTIVGFTHGQTSEDYEARLVGEVFHMPQGAAESIGTDAILRVVDQTTNTLYCFRQPNTDHALHTLDPFKGYALSSDGSGFDLPSLPPTYMGPIRPEELAAGQIDHMMGMSVTYTSGTPVGWFAGSDSTGNSGVADSNSDNELSFGDVVYLGMSASAIDALAVPDWTKTLLHGLRTYGALVGYNGGVPWALKWANPLEATSLGQPDPWATYFGAGWGFDFQHALDSVGGWGAKLKVMDPTSLPPR